MYLGGGRGGGLSCVSLHDSHTAWILVPTRGAGGSLRIGWRVFRESALVQGRRPLRVGPQCAGVVPCARACVCVCVCVCVRLAATVSEWRKLRLTSLYANGRAEETISIL